MMDNPKWKHYIAPPPKTEIPSDEESHREQALDEVASVDAEMGSNG